MTAGKPPDAAGRAAALDLSRHVLAVAPAGSGKTGLLVRRLLRALAQVDAPEQVVAITFTIKAAAEIRARVITLLERAARADAPENAEDAAALADAKVTLAQDARHGWRLTEQPHRLFASTIDSLNGRLALQAPLLSGLGGPARICEDARGLYQQAVLELLAQIEGDTLAADDRAALAQVLRLGNNRVDALIEPLSELLARREQWLEQAASGAWREQERAILEDIIGATLRAFNAAMGPGDRASLLDCLRGASGYSGGEAFAFARELGAWPQPVSAELETWRALAGCLLTDSAKLRKVVNTKQGFPPGLAHTRAMKQLLERFNAHASFGPLVGLVHDLPAATHSAAYTGLRDALMRVLLLLEAELRQVFGARGEVDFSEIAARARTALGSGEEIGDALLAADRRIRHLLVDEMQDTSELQMQLLHKLTSGWEQGDGRSIFLVGDPQQSIYAFRKAEVRLFQQLIADRALGQLPLEVVTLSANFRSAPELVAWFNAAFGTIFPPSDDLYSGAVAYTRSAAQSARAGEVRLLTWLGADDDYEAARVAEVAGERIAQGGSVAILTRARAHLTETLAALRRRGLPYRCTDMDPLSVLPAVGDVVSLARALWHPEDRLHWARLLRAPFVGLSWSDLLALSRGRLKQSWPARLAGSDTADLSEAGRLRVERLRRALEALAQDPQLRARLADRTEAIWHALNGPACVSATEFEDVQSALRLLRLHSPGGEFGELEAFERALSELFASPSEGAIEVMTIHKAKGLEFDHVLLPALNRKARGEGRPLVQARSVPGGELLAPSPPPHWPDTESDSIAAARFYDYVQGLHVRAREQETLRLLYVAATRAKRTLTLFCRADADKKGAARLLSGSFAAYLAPLLPPFAPAAVALRSPDARGEVPRSPRLPLEVPLADWRAPDLFRPREQRRLRPSEAVLAVRDDKREEEADLFARLVGTLFHEALHKIALDGLDAWGDAGASKRTALAAGFRRLGLPEPQVEAAVARVQELLRATLAGKTGRWLLAPRAWAQGEYHLTGYLEGRWVSGVIDRCFEEADGALWAVDYKTTPRALAGEALESFMRNARRHYADQLRLYARLLGTQRPGKTLRAGFYFPDADRLVELTDLSGNPDRAAQLSLDISPGG